MTRVVEGSVVERVMKTRVREVVWYGVVRSERCASVWVLLLLTQQGGAVREARLRIQPVCLEFVGIYCPVVKCVDTATS